MKKYIIGFVWVLTHSVQATFINSTPSLALSTNQNNGGVVTKKTVETPINATIFQLTESATAAVLEPKIDLIKQAFGDMPDDPNSPCVEKKPKDKPVNASEHSNKKMIPRADIAMADNENTHKPC